MRRAVLMPIPFDGYLEKEARVTFTCPVRVSGNRYSMPFKFAGQRLSTRLNPDQIIIAAERALVASHVRLPEHVRGRQDDYDAAGPPHASLPYRGNRSCPAAASLISWKRPATSFRFGTLIHTGGAIAAAISARLNFNRQAGLKFNRCERSTSTNRCRH